MKIKFTEAPKGRDHKIGDVVEFNGPIPEGYARKYIARGWAEEYVEPKPEPKPEPVRQKLEMPMVTDKEKVSVQANQGKSTTNK